MRSIICFFFYVYVLYYFYKVGGILETLVFKKYGMKIKLNQITALIGPESSGKTTVFKLLSNKVHNESVYLDRKRLNDYKLVFLRRNVMTIFEIEDFNCEYVKEELAYFLKKFKETESNISTKISNMTHYFHIEDIIDYKISALTIEEKALIKILSFLIVSPLILGIDNLFSYISLDSTELVIKFAKEHNIALIYTSTDVEKIKFADEVHIIYKFKSIRNGNYESIFKDKIIRELGLEVPFIKELNEYLQDYELTNKDFNSINEGVRVLWK